MREISRRVALKAGLSFTISAATVSFASAHPNNDDIEPTDGLSPTKDAFASRAQNSVEYWNDVSLELVANDHTIEVGQARAPGPVASARALGLIHTVIADAVALAYPDPLFKPFLFRDALNDTPTSPASFVGGACAAIMSHIYDGPEHEVYLRTKRTEFLRMVGLRHRRAWLQGQQFGSHSVYRDKWNWPDIRARIDNKNHKYVIEPRRHSVDPFNPDQGYYGHSWGVEPAPLVLSKEEVTKKIKDGGCAPPDPPSIGSPEYQRDLEDVKLVGELLGGAESAHRTREQVLPGIFWAYDGAILIGTPPRQYNQFVRQVARADKLGPRRLSRLLALCNLAMSDAGNVAWHAKYLHKVWRPVRGLNPDLPEHPAKEDIKWVPHGSPRTNRADFAFFMPFSEETELQSMVSLAAKEQETAQSLLGGTPKPSTQDPDPAYKAAAFTPNFPAYPSGHATFGTACFTMLRLVRGERFADPAWVNIRRFTSDELREEAVDNFEPKVRDIRPDDFLDLEKAIEDNSRSRVYLGVHWQFDADGGREAGESVAKVIHAKAYTK
ncbi:vanadium-dependent haloperoxidase [Rhizobium leguminosarum]|nr:vanadium-dependent haloperoxidase [Rhizobium leguminosarum]